MQGNLIIKNTVKQKPLHLYFQLIIMCNPVKCNIKISVWIYWRFLIQKVFLTLPEITLSYSPNLALTKILNPVHRKTQDVEVQGKIDKKHKDISKRVVLGCDFISCNRFHALHLEIFRQIQYVAISMTEVSSVNFKLNFTNIWADIWRGFFEEVYKC